MKDSIKKVVKDLSNQLSISIQDDDIHFFNEGTTNSVVFSIKNKYVVKIVDENMLNAQVEFLGFYKDVDEFQKIIFYNKELKYLCFKYIDGEKFDDKNQMNDKDFVMKIYNMVKHYKEYKSERYGYLWDSHKEWAEFLLDEIIYASGRLNQDLKIPIEKVYYALEEVKKWKIKKYLIHGDMGTHNFLVSNNNIMVIDPMPIVGDYLYDFYFAMLSNIELFDENYLKYILAFYNRNIKYKKALFIIVLYIRMCRCYIYNKKDFDMYLSLYKTIK